MKFSEAVAFRTKELLRKNNMSQYRLEKLSTIPHGTMIDLMKGTYKTASFKTVMLIVRAFDIKTSEFFDSPVFDDKDLDID